MGHSHFSFDGERKVYKRKPAARRLREKALYCPFLKEGVRNVARSIVGEITPTFVRARAHSYPLSKRARLFPSAAYRRSAPPQLAWGILTSCGLKGFLRLGCFATQKNEGLCFPAVDGGQSYPLQGGRLLGGLIALPRPKGRLVLPHSGRRAGLPIAGRNIIVATKASVCSFARWPFQRAMRPVAEWRSESATKQGAAPDSRAARPVVERR